MKKTTYTNKLKDILKLDQFEKVEKTRKNAKQFIIKEEERINNTLWQLVIDNELTEEQYCELKSMGGQPPRLYGLAKVHKNTVPVRPVLSMPGSPYYQVADAVTKWLSVVPQANIQCSSKKVADQLNEVELGEDETIISFDVVSLYTNVPVEEAIDEATEELYSGKHELPPVSKETFRTLLKLSC